MFTGIIEAQGVILRRESDGSNLRFWVESPLSQHLHPDQSLSHDGVCLTVEETGPEGHRATAIAETLKRTRLDAWQPGRRVNLERCLAVNGRFDGHIVQGHVDGLVRCTGRQDLQGSHELEFEFDPEQAALLVEKGSIALNGVSLTVFAVTERRFRIAVIPYTWTHTNLSALQPGDMVHAEFDILGKYAARWRQLQTGNPYDRS